MSGHRCSTWVPRTGLFFQGPQHGRTGEHMPHCSLDLSLFLTPLPSAQELGYLWQLVEAKVSQSTVGVADPGGPSSNQAGPRAQGQEVGSLMHQ